MADNPPIVSPSVPVVLFVDDEPSILQALKRMLSGSDWQVRLACSGAEALALMQREAVDLVISDMRMPEMDGAALLKEVQRKHPQVVRLLLTGYADIEATVAAINQGKIYSYLQKPWDDKELLTALQNAWAYKQREDERLYLQLLTARQNVQLQQFNDQLEAKVAERTRELQQALERLAQSHNTLKQTYRSSVSMLSYLLERGGSHHAGHGRWVAEQAASLANKVGLGSAEREQLHVAALLHDIGTLGMPERLLTAPYDQLTTKEATLFQRHCTLGEGALMEMEALQEAAQMIRQHHESLDGSGYPDGLKGTDICTGARILRIVSDYHALVSGRLEGGKVEPGAALVFLQQHAGTRYDAILVKAFLQQFEGKAETPACEQQLSTKDLEPGMVLQDDLVTDTGVLLLSRGYQLHSKLIDKLQHFERDTGSHFLVTVAYREIEKVQSGQ